MDGAISVAQSETDMLQFFRTFVLIVFYFLFLLSLLLESLAAIRIQWITVKFPTVFFKWRTWAYHLWLQNRDSRSNFLRRRRLILKDWREVCGFLDWTLYFAKVSHQLCSHWVSKTPRSSIIKMRNNNVNRFYSSFLPLVKKKNQSAIFNDGKLYENTKDASSNN